MINCEATASLQRRGKEGDKVRKGEGEEGWVSVEEEEKSREKRDGRVSVEEWKESREEGGDGRVSVEEGEGWVCVDEGKENTEAPDLQDGQQPKREAPPLLDEPISRNGPYFSEKIALISGLKPLYRPW